MKRRTQARAMWHDPEFQATHRPALVRALAEGATVDGVNLPGVVLGAQSPLGLWNVGLYQRPIRRSDFSFGLFETSFVQAQIEDSTFRACDFVCSSFQKTVVTRVIFDGSRFEASSFLDAVIVETSFRECRFKDRRALGSSFVRAKLVGSDFTDARFKNTEFRAARFDNCAFDGALFEGCDLRGTKFLGGAPSEQQLQECSRS